MKYQDKVNQAVLNFFGITNKNIGAVNVRLRPGNLPVVTVQHVYLGEYGSNRAPGIEVHKYVLATSDANDTITRLNGEMGVLCGLLRECLNVIDTIDGESVEESERLGDLHEKICAAIEFKG